MIVITADVWVSKDLTPALAWPRQAENSGMWLLIISLIVSLWHPIALDHANLQYSAERVAKLHEQHTMSCLSQTVSCYLTASSAGYCSQAEGLQSLNCHMPWY